MPPSQPMSEYISGEIIFTQGDSLIVGRCTMQQLAVDGDIMVVLIEKLAPEVTHVFLMSRVERLKLVASAIERVGL